MQTVAFEDEQVMTMREIAEKIAPRLGWRTFDVSPRSGTICFTSEDARAFQMNLAGTAFAIRDGVVSPTGDADESADIAEALDIPHLVWGRDEEGEWVCVRC